MGLLEKWVLSKMYGQMDQANIRKGLLVLGVHLKSEGYPNTLFRLQGLEASSLFQVVEINMPMWNESTQNRHGFSRLTRNIFKSVTAHVAVIVRFLATKKRPKQVYVTYPAVFVLFLLSYLPSKLRPQRVVADVFISLYDTIVLDRRLLKKESIPARILKSVEKRAYVYADKLVADTPQNARFLCSLFELSMTKALVTPLSTDEIHFNYTPYRPKPGTCRILFVGTLVPLHGVGTILEAVHLLAGRSDIQFKLIGDGQDAPLVEAWIQRYTTQLDWERNWQSSERIAEEIALADICLGIFGTQEKTQRVCPFKIYAYAAMGRAIITGETAWLKETTELLSNEPFASVPVGDGAALAAKIVLLADNPTLRAKLAANSHEFYQTHLGNQLALNRLTSCLLKH
jgi:glycosyltransferase involved in cell wall biosynthesis